jgi:cytochrome c
MKKIVSLIIVFAAAWSIASAQGKHGTPAQAEAMAKKAVEFVKANGVDKSIEAFNDLKGKFVDGDLYILLYTLDGKCLAHGANPKIVGKDMIDMKDADGKLFVRERMEIAKGKGKGWQNYKWTNPVSQKIEDKTTYVQRVGDVVVCCGAYKK